MCGIAGYSGSWDPGILARMSSRIAHRGPDDAGEWHDAERGVGLAHRRLSIIDLSPLGHQPMWDVTGAVGIVYNGEIYNYRELRRELEADGFAFRSRSDTEVVLNLYRRDGEAMLPKLNGIYAFALWDPARGALLLARDAMGVKPLYYATTPSGLLFASEMKALLVAAEVDREIDPRALRDHLAYLWCPAPATALRGVRKLEPGSAVWVRDGRLDRTFEHSALPVGIGGGPTDPEEAAKEVRAAVDVAVERQMVADVPVGAFLSGGLDSSSVVAMARRHASGRLRCFTIAFRNGSFREEGTVDDLGYARRAAEALDVDLEVVETGPEMIDRLDDTLWHLDEPTADPAPIHVWLISELARKAGIKVLLSGSGGDDIFTGYRRHLAVERERYWAWLPRAARRGLARAASRLPVGSSTARRLRKAFRHAALDGDARIASYFLWTEPPVLRSLLGPRLREVRDEPVTATLERSLGRLDARTSSLDRMLHLEGRHFLADHNLNYADKMSMAVGVETRVPLLDPDLVRLAASLPASLKQRGAEGKWIFKRAMEDVLPREIVWRPKTGFGAPVRRWLRQELRPLVQDVLSRRSIEDRGLFDPDGVARLVEADRAGRIDGSYTILTLLCVELWSRRFLAAPTAAPVG